MKALKLALIGSAALAAASVSARADDLNALKAQIEALNARVASMETTASVPAGYQMVSFSKNEKGEHVISIMPTADAPAATEIVWSGNVRAAVVARRDTSRLAVAVAPTANALGQGVQDQYSLDVYARARIGVTGKTDTAVGEVGATVGLVSATTPFGYQTNSAIATDGYWGWWKMTPNLTLGGGVAGTLADNNYDWDSQCGCFLPATWVIGNSTFNAGDPAQIRLTYADGPLSFAIAVEDSNNTNNGTNVSALGVAAKATYAADIFALDLSGGYWGNATGQATWIVDAGAQAKFDMFTLGGSVGVGHGFNGAAIAAGARWSGVAVPAGGFDYVDASGYISLALGDSASFKAGVSHGFGTGASDALAGATIYGAGLYYTPVKQLTIGAEGSYQTGGLANQSYVADLITVFSF